MEGYTEEEIDIYFMPEFGADAYLLFREILPSWPNVNVYESLAAIDLTVERLDIAMDFIAKADEQDLKVSLAKRDEYLQRMKNVRARLTKVWRQVLESKLASLGSTETCESLTEPGSGVFSWLYEPGIFSDEPYDFPGEWQRFGITKAESQTHYTPEYTAPDMYLSETIEAGQYLDIALGKIRQVLDDRAESINDYECIEEIVFVPPKQESKGSKKGGFPIALLAIGAVAILAAGRR